VRPSVTSAAGNTSGSAAAGCCAGINGNGEGDEDGDDDDDDDDDISMEYVLTEALTPGHTQEWTLPFPASGESSEAASTSGPLRPREISLKLNAPENLQLTVIRCTFSRVEDVGEDFRTQLKVAYT